MLNTIKVTIGILREFDRSSSGSPGGNTGGAGMMLPSIDGVFVAIQLQRRKNKCSEAQPHQVVHSELGYFD